MSEWKTAIAKSDPNETLIRGYELKDLIGNLRFSEIAYLVLKGELPTKEQGEVLDAIFVACVDHGLGPPSVTAARNVFSGGNPLNAAVAAGILAIGDSHGGAIEQAAKIFQENNGKNPADLVKEFSAVKKRFPGYGHKVYTTDPRAVELVKVADKNKVSGKCVAFAQSLEKEIEKGLGKKLCLNVDGAIAAIISDMGFDWKLGKGLFIIPRSVGLVAHVHEEWLREQPFRREENTTYDGPAKRELPVSFKRK